MASRILHISDLHVGARDDPVLEPALREIVEIVDPAVILASGDLTHRGRADQHARAAALLRALDRPVVAVPGNHDIPYSFPARFSSPWRLFDAEWGSTEPLLDTDGVRIVGVNSVRPWRHQSGGLNDAALARAESRLRGAADGALRIVCLHHPLTGAPWRSRKRPLARRTLVLERLVDAGADLIVSGHIHQAAVSERHEFEVGAPRGTILAVAPGAGQPRPSRRGEARGALTYVVDDDRVVVEAYIRLDDAFRLTASRTFAR